MMIVLDLLLVLAALFLIAVILLQSGKSAGLSESLGGGGGGDTFMSKNKGRSWDKRLAKLTKWVGLGFALTALAVNLIS